MALKRIHVAQDAIRRNTKNGTNEPVIIVRDGRKPTRHHNVKIEDDNGNLIAEIVYRPHDPLSCGARLWIETRAKVTAS